MYPEGVSKNINTIIMVEHEQATLKILVLCSGEIILWVWCLSYMWLLPVQVSSTAHGISEKGIIPECRGRSKLRAQSDFHLSKINTLISNQSLVIGFCIRQSKFLSRMGMRYTF